MCLINIWMHYKEKQDREQIMMVSYETMIVQDNPVRLIDLLCKKFISDNPLREEWKGSTNKGCKSYPPTAMLSLLVYGYFNGIASSRRLERETHRNLEVIWLLNGFHPDHWTICEFRRNNEKLIKKLLKSFRKFLLDKKYASGTKLVFDGSKIKAYASREMLNSEGISRKLENLDKSIAEYLKQIDDNDSNESELEKAHDKIKKLKKKIEKLKYQRNKLEGLEKQLQASEKNHIAPNDKDAVLVKGRDGMFAGYNAQTGVDAKGHFIMYDQIISESNDLGLIENCVTQAIEETGVIPEELLADKGYSNIMQILNIESNNIQCYIPLQDTYRTRQERQGLVFIYDEIKDIYICPTGKTLKLTSKNQKDSVTNYNLYRCYECEGCPIRDDCTTSKRGRFYKRSVEQNRIDKYKQKLSSDYAKEKIAERKGVVEHPYGTIKWLMGKFNFLLIGKEKAQIELDLYSTAYNLKRLINCCTFMGLTCQIMEHNWSIS